MKKLRDFESHVREELEALRRQVSDLQRFHHERACVFEEAHRIGQAHSVLNRLLYIAIENISLEDMLQKFLYEVTSLSWLALQSKGAIFSADSTRGVLKLSAHRAMHAEMVKKCGSVPFGKCICGRAASSGKIQFTDRVGDQHDQKYEGMSQHGHYCVPIVSRDREVLGVLTLYVNVGHRRNQYEEDFLMSVANTLACLVELKKNQEQLEEKALELEHRRRDLDEINTTLRVLLNKRDEDRIKLEEELILNVKEFVQPYLEDLKRTQLSSLQQDYTDTIESNLKNILSPFRRKLSNPELSLTATELQVADSITAGRRTKEIARFLNVSEKTIAVHRRNIRRKLSLQNTKTSLRAFLLSFQK